MNPAPVFMEIPLPPDVPPSRGEVPPEVAAHWLIARIWTVGRTLYVEAWPRVPPFHVAAVTQPDTGDTLEGLTSWLGSETTVGRVVPPEAHAADAGDALPIDGEDYLRWLETGKGSDPTEGVK